MKHLFVFFGLWFFIQPCLALTLSQGTEVHVLKADPVQGQPGKFSLLGLQLQFDASKPDEPPQLKPVRLNYDSASPHSKLFNNNLDDLLLSRHTRDIRGAHYLKTYSPVAAVPANEEWQKFQAEHPDWDKHFYRGRRNHMTLINDATPLNASDVAKACPHPPQQKDGEACSQGSARSLNETLRNNIKEAADHFQIPPEVLASVVQLESNFNPLVENQEEKTDCISKGAGCPTNGWGKGFGQLGKANSAKYGINWEVAVPSPTSCQSSPASERCIQDLDSQCERYGGADLKPWNCPKASLFATAKKISQLIPENHHVWIQKTKMPVKLEAVNISQKLRELPPVERTRALLAIYARGPRYLNSWAEFYDQMGRWPTSYGELWMVPRVDESPSKIMGYQMLTNEFTNRCYVYSVAGICGDLPVNSVAAHYRAMLGVSDRVVPQLPEPQKSDELPVFMSTE